MRRVGDRQAAGERAAVPAGELAGVQDDRGDLALGDANLDATARERGIDRVVVAIDTQNGCCGTRTTIRRSQSGKTAAAAASARTPRSAVRPGRHGRCDAPAALTFSHQPSNCSWKSSGFANCRPGSKFDRMKRCERSSSPLACASPASRITQPTPSCPQNAANASVGRPPPAIAASRSQTSFSGSAPIRDKQRPRPHRMSGASLEKISAPAITRDQHSSAVTT